LAGVNVTGLRALALVLLAGATCVVVSGSALSAAASPSSRASAAANVLQPAPDSGIGVGVATASASPDNPQWLAEINRYRVASGLAPVVDQPSWDAGILDHLNYVATAPKTDLAGPYASLHTENPASAEYTTDGSTEAARSDLYFGADGLTPTAFIDGWLSAPFHAIGMLRARLTQVAFAATGGSAAGLDVIGGLDDDRPAATGPILFPGNGMTTNLVSYTGGESPDPLQTCGWSPNSTYGLPLIALLPDAPVAGLTAQVVGTDGRTLSSANNQLCVVDELTYRSSDPVYGPTGEQILSDDHAVLLLVRQPYAAATYTATITQPGRAAISWAFTAAP
jgi:hypothetical protein